MSKENLRLWQDRLARNEAAFELAHSRMDEREIIYEGTRRVRPVSPEDKDVRDTPHVRNIAGEIIESQVDNTIPKPKVTPKRKADEKKAKLIEDMLLCELDRLNIEYINDQLSRTVPIQGGGLMHVEWDNTKRTHTTLGEVAVSDIHPKQFVPQDGVYKGIQDMDYLIIKLPQTKGYIKRKYGVDVSDEYEAEPDIKGVNEPSADDMVTQYMAYYKNDEGGIGLYSWVCDTELCDIPDYQARQRKKCKKCGAVINGTEIHIPPTSDGSYPLGVYDASSIEYDDYSQSVGFMTNHENKHKEKCPYCESTSFEMVGADYEELASDIIRTDGTVIQASVAETITEYDEFGRPYESTVFTPAKIPYYKPDLFPVVLIKNVSAYGKILGESDIDKVEDAQNTTNRLWRKVLDKMTAAGSYITLPPDATIKRGSEEMMCIYLDNPADKALIGVFDMEGNISQDIVALNQAYEESRQQIGITDSYQGRVDRTATSGKAKEFAAVQSAGRLESKRIMKETAFAELYELIFKFKLAYADEPRPVISRDIHGNAVYTEFNRYDFLEVDAAGEYYWNDDFLFSCDSVEPLSKNREAMWQETRLNFQSGAFGNPAELKTIILFWRKMEDLHYPGAAETKAYLEEELERQNQMQMQMIAEQQAQMQAEAQSQMAYDIEERARAQAQHDSNTVREVIERAKNDARRDAGATHQGRVPNIR